MTVETTGTPKPGKRRLRKPKQPAVTVEQVTAQLRQLSPARLASVLDYASYLVHQDEAGTVDGLLASRAVLAREWDSPEDDEAWADLLEWESGDSPLQGDCDDSRDNYRTQAQP